MNQKNNIIDQNDKYDLKKYIRNVKNFPKKGILFRDISSLLANGEALYKVTNILAKYAKDCDAIIGPDARGFIFGTPIAYKLKKPFIMVRKPGKLPGKVIREEYQLEYGFNMLEIQEGAIKPGMKIFVVDDLLATGGTTRAIIDLIQKQGGIVIKTIFIIELIALKGRENFEGIEVHSLVKY